MCSVPAREKMHSHAFPLAAAVLIAVVCAVRALETHLACIGSVKIPNASDIASGQQPQVEGDVAALGGLKVIGVLGCFPAVERAFPSLASRGLKQAEICAVRYSDEVALLVVLGACRPRSVGDIDNDDTEAMIEVALAKLSDAVMLVADESVTDALRTEARALRVSQRPDTPKPLAAHVLRGDEDITFRIYRTTMAEMPPKASTVGGVGAALFDSQRLVHCVTASRKIEPCVDKVVARLRTRGSQLRRAAPLTLQTIAASVAAHARRFAPGVVPRGDDLCWWMNAPYIVRGAATIAAAMRDSSDKRARVHVIRIEYLTQRSITRLECDVARCAHDTVVIAAGYEDDDNTTDARVVPHVAAYRIPFHVSHESEAALLLKCTDTLVHLSIPTVEFDFAEDHNDQGNSWMVTVLIVILVVLIIGKITHAAHDGTVQWSLL